MPLVLLAPHSVSHNLLQRNELSSDQTFQLHMNADGSIMGFKRSAQKKKKKKVSSAGWITAPGLQLVVPAASSIPSVTLGHRLI